MPHEVFFGGRPFWLWGPVVVTYAAGLTADQWYRLTQQDFGEEAKGEMLEFLCFFGAIGPTTPKASIAQDAKPGWGFTE